MKNKSPQINLCALLLLSALISLMSPSCKPLLAKGAMVKDSLNTGAGLNDSSTELHLPENILSFGNYLYCSKDYLRAIGEYENYLRHRNNDTVRFRIASGYGKLGLTKEAEYNFSLLKSSPLSGAATLEIARGRFIRKDYQALRILYDTASGVLPGNSVNSFRMLYFYSFLMEPPAAGLPEEGEFLRNFPAGDQTEIRKLYLRKKNPPFRSPYTAAILSAIIPGAGKVYAGQLGDGITSAVVTGLLGYLSYSSFNAGHNFRGWLFTGITAYFYAGNIYGSAAAAQIFNASVSFSLSRELEVFINRKNHYIPVPDDNCR